jgi:alpha-tubulin suppressor-like RCC1 family protein
MFSSKRAFQTADDPQKLAYHYAQDLQAIDLTFGTQAGQVYLCGSQEFNMLRLDPLDWPADSNRDEDSAGAVALTKHKFFEKDSIRQVVAGGSHTVALNTDGDVYTWGVNDEGNLGREGDGIAKVDGLRDIIQVVAGESFTLCLDREGQVYMFGMYRDGEQTKFGEPATPGGDPTGYRTKPVRITTMPGKVLRVAASGAGNFCAAVMEDHSLVTWGKYNVGR